MRIAALAATRAPAPRRSRRPEVGPLAEVGLAKQEHAGRAKASDYRGIDGRRRSRQRERPSGRQHAVAGIDVVLDEYRDAMQRPAHPAFATLIVKPVGDLLPVGVELNDGA